MVCCGGARELRKREARSDKCRATPSRCRQTQLQTTRDRDTRTALDAIARLVQVTLGRLGQEGAP